jgi:O-antigen ligase
VIALCIAALGVLFARAPFMICLAVVLGVIGGILLLRRPTIGLYVLAFAIPFGSLYEFHIARLTVGASECLVLSITAAWLLRMMATRKVTFARSKLVMAILLYVVAVALSLWPAQEMLSAFKALAKWVEFLLLYLFVASELGHTDRQILVASLLLAGTLEGTLGIYQFVRQVGPPGFVLFDRYMRAHGTFLQPNPFGGYLGLLLPTAYATAITVWQDLLAKPSVPGTGQKRSPWLLSLGLLATVSALVMGIALVMSWSRGALLGLAGGFVMISLALRRRAWVAIAVVALFLVLTSPLWSGVVPTDLIGRLEGLAEYMGQDLTTVEITDDTFAVIERVAHWQAAWRMFTMRPWLGVGSGRVGRRGHSGLGRLPDHAAGGNDHRVARRSPRARLATWPRAGGTGYAWSPADP